jgi:hypothetical protein
METQRERTSNKGALVGAGGTLPPSTASSARRRSLRTEARRRRIMANVVFVCSSAVAIGVFAIAYALLKP